MRVCAMLARFGSGLQEDRVSLGQFQSGKASYEQRHCGQRGRHQERRSHEHLIGDRAYEAGYPHAGGD